MYREGPLARKLPEKGDNLNNLRWPWHKLARNITWRSETVVFMFQKSWLSTYVIACSIKPGFWLVAKPTGHGIPHWTSRCWSADEELFCQFQEFEMQLYCEDGGHWTLDTMAFIIMPKSSIEIQTRDHTNAYLYLWKTFLFLCVYRVLFL